MHLIKPTAFVIKHRFIAVTMTTKVIWLGLPQCIISIGCTTMQIMCMSAFTCQGKQFVCLNTLVANYFSRSVFAKESPTHTLHTRALYCDFAFNWSICEGCGPDQLCVELNLRNLKPQLPLLLTVLSQKFSAACYALRRHGDWVKRSMLTQTRSTWKQGTSPRFSTTDRTLVREMSQEALQVWQQWMWLRRLKTLYNN